MRERDKEGKRKMPPRAAITHRGKNRKSRRGIMADKNEGKKEKGGGK